MTEACGRGAGGRGPAAEASGHERARVLLDEDDGGDVRRGAAAALEEGAPGVALQRREARLPGAPVPVQDEVHAAVAEVAHAVEEDDRAGVGREELVRAGPLLRGERCARRVGRAGGVRRVSSGHGPGSAARDDLCAHLRARPLRPNSLREEEEGPTRSLTGDGCRALPPQRHRPSSAPPRSSAVYAGCPQARPRGQMQSLSTALRARATRARSGLTRHVTITAPRNEDRGRATRLCVHSRGEHHRHSLREPSESQRRPAEPT